MIPPGLPEDPEPDREPTSQDTALLEPVPRGLRLSAFVLISAVLAAAVFLAGVYVARPSKAQVVQLPASVRPAATPKPPAATAADYFFGIAVTSTRPDKPAPYVAAGVPRLYLHYALPGWPAGAKLTFHWSLQGKSLPASLASWHRQSRASFATGYYDLTPPEAPPSLRPAAKGPEPAQGPASGFPPGIYQVRVDGPDQLSEIGSFVVMSGLQQMLAQQTPASAVLISPPTLASAVDGKSMPAKPLPSPVPSYTRKLFACFTYQDAAPGTMVDVRWFVGDHELHDARSQVTLPSVSGQASAWFERQGDPLPEGKWTVAVYLPGAGKPSAQTSFTVSAGTPR